MNVETANKIIKLAKTHAVKNDSALLCYTDAINLIEKQEPVYAARRALDSLAYSVGIFHPDYNAAKNL
jgi:hypothetical protein